MQSEASSGSEIAGHNYPPSKLTSHKSSQVVSQVPSSFWQAHLPHFLLALAILAYALYFADLTLTRYAAFESRALDMGNMDQAVWNTAHGNWFHLTNQPGVVNRLSLHVEPILVPISWLYWIHSGPETLLLLQAVVVALGALPTFAIAYRELRNRWLALVFALAFLLNPSMQAANWLEFHPVTLAPTFILAAFYFLRVDRIGWFALFAVLTAVCKEEMSLLVFMLGFYALLFLRRTRLGLTTMVLAVSWAFLAVFVIQNTFATGNIHWGRYDYLGESPLGMVLTLLTQPGVVLGQLQAADALMYVARILLPVAFFALLAPEVLLLALPSLGINLLADFSPMHQVSELIYAAPLVPFVTAAGILGASRVLNWLQVAGGKWQMDGLRTAATTMLMLAVLGCMFVNQYWYGYLPWGGNYRAFAITEHDRKAAAIIAQIPPDAKVSAQDRLNPHVSGRETIYIFPRVDDADTIFLDVIGPAWPQHPNDLRATVDTLFTQGFGVAAAADGYLLLRQEAKNQEIPDTFYTAWQETDPAHIAATTIDFAATMRLVDWRVETDAHGELVTKLYWHLLQPSTRDLRFHIAYLDREGHELFSTQFYPPVAALWYPTTLWPVYNPDSLSSIVSSTVASTGPATIVIQTLPWTLEADHFALVLGVYAGDGWATGDRLPITSITPPLPSLEGGTLARLGGYRQTEANRWEAIPLVGVPPKKTLDARFDTSMLLAGVTVPQTTLAAGDILRFTLHWRATAPLPADYTSYVHLRDGAGNTVAQLDWQPHDAIGQLPTSAWLVGQPVVDTQSLTLPATLPPGDYALFMGLYRWQDGIITIPGAGTDLLPGDVVQLAQIRVE